MRLSVHIKRTFPRSSHMPESQTWAWTKQCTQPLSFAGLCPSLWHQHHMYRWSNRRGLSGRGTMHPLPKERRGRLRNNPREVAKGKRSAQRKIGLWNRKLTSLSGALSLSMESRCALDSTLLGWAAAKRTAGLATFALFEWEMANPAARTTRRINMSPPMGFISEQQVHFPGGFRVPQMKVPK